MTMHLEHQALTMTGKRRGKQKYASAEAKRKAQELEQSWQSNMRQWQSMSKPTIFKPKPSSAEALRPKYPPGREPKQSIPSLDSKHIGAVSSRPVQMYTGDKIIGIGTLHKSNAVPVFSDTEAKDLATMRRG